MAVRRSTIPDTAFIFQLDGPDAKWLAEQLVLKLEDYEAAPEQFHFTWHVEPGEDWPADKTMARPCPWLQ